MKRVAIVSGTNLQVACFFTRLRHPWAPAAHTASGIRTLALSVTFERLETQGSASKGPNEVSPLFAGKVGMRGFPQSAPLLSGRQQMWITWRMSAVSQVWLCEVNLWVPISSSLGVQSLEWN